MTTQTATDQLVDAILKGANAPRTDEQVKLYCADLFGCKPHDIRIISSHLGGRGPSSFAVNGSHQARLVPVVDSQRPERQWRVIW